MTEPSLCYITICGRAFKYNNAWTILQTNYIKKYPEWVVLKDLQVIIIHSQG